MMFDIVQNKLLCSVLLGFDVALTASRQADRRGSSPYWLPPYRLPPSPVAEKATRDQEKKCPPGTI
jgi:hypothetical protein